MSKAQNTPNGSPASIKTPTMTAAFPNQPHNADTQIQYWKQFTQLKEHGFYLQEYINRDEYIDWLKNVAIAIGSSASIGGWVIWRELPWLWSGIICFTQVIQALSPHLPWRQRAKILRKYSSEIDSLSISVEEDWYKVSSGKLSDDEISALYIKYKRKILQISENNAKELSLPKNIKLTLKAKQSSQIYFKNHYNTGA